jgi:hypothetical protein
LLLGPITLRLCRGPAWNVRLLAQSLSLGNYGEETDRPTRLHMSLKTRALAGGPGSEGGEEGVGRRKRVKSELGARPGWELVGLRPSNRGWVPVPSKADWLSEETVPSRKTVEPGKQGYDRGDPELLRSSQSIRKDSQLPTLSPLGVTGQGFFFKLHSRWFTASLIHSTHRLLFSTLCFVCFTASFASLSAAWWYPIPARRCSKL